MCDEQSINIYFIKLNRFIVEEELLGVLSV